MNEWQQRVVEERKELNEKLAKLHAFLSSIGTQPVDTAVIPHPIDLALLMVQAKVMQAYLETLDARIVRFVTTA